LGNVELGRMTILTVPYCSVKRWTRKYNRQIDVQRSVFQQNARILSYHCQFRLLKVLLHSGSNGSPRPSRVANIQGMKCAWSDVLPEWHIHFSLIGISWRPCNAGDLKSLPLCVQRLAWPYISAKQHWLAQSYRVFQLLPYLTLVTHPCSAKPYLTWILNTTFQICSIFDEYSTWQDNTTHQTVRKWRR